MSGAGAYLAGLLTVPTIVVVGCLVAIVTEPGVEITCACGYNTGPMRETWRITCWLRWRWHRLGHALGARS